MCTVGVAIAVPEPWAKQLQEYRTSIGDLTACQIPTHVTLVPPTDVARADLDGVVEHLARVTAGFDSFRIHLRGTSTFRPVSPVVFVTVVQGIAECERLANVVRTGPLDVELAYPYHPHVTIAHHLDDAVLDRAFDELATFDCQFDVTEFHLYTHDDQAGWQPTRTFPLG